MGLRFPNACGWRADGGNNVVVFRGTGREVGEEGTHSPIRSWGTISRDRLDLTSITLNF